MNITVLGSSSKGNCYLAGDGTTNIMLECGLPYKEIQRKLNFDLGGIAACLLSHEHKDHSKSVVEVINRGIPIYTSVGTIEMLDITLNCHLLKPVINLKPFDIGSFKVMPFDLVHDCKEPYGYLITSIITGEKLVFITDTMYCKYRFKELTHIMIECNYVDDLLKENTQDKSLIKRIYKSHMSLNTCIEFLKSNDLRKVKQIILLHLSDERSDENLMLESVRKATGKYVTIA